jgi:YVTN family beta-propeller protein
VGNDPRGIAVNPVSPTAYVTNFADDTLSVINTTTSTVTDTIPLREGIAQKGPQGIVVSPDGAKVYVVNGWDNSVSVVNSLTKTVVARIPVGLRPQDIALTKDGSHALVTNHGSDSVSVIDTQTDTVITTIAVGKGPDGIATSPLPGSTRAYVAHFLAEPDGTTFALDTSTNTTVGDALILGFQPTKVAFAPDGRRVYISNFAADIVSVIDPVANTVLSSLSVTDHPEGIAITPNGKRIYVALYGDNGSGSFIQVSSTISSLAEFIEVDEGPFALAIAP